MIRIGENIRVARTKKGFSKEYMADKMAISAQSYNELESENQNSLTWGQIFEIASLLDTDVESLVISQQDTQPQKSTDKKHETDELIELVRIQKELLTALKNNAEIKILS